MLICIKLYIYTLAGLDPADRSQVEAKFMNREIRVIGMLLAVHLYVSTSHAKRT